jgi:hypothetical protein
MEVVWMTPYDFRWVKSTSASPFWGPSDLDISIYSDSVTSQRETTTVCPTGCLSVEKLNWDSQQGRDLATSGHNKENFQSGQSYSYIMRKVWYNQIWIQTYFGFIVLILTYM